MNIDNMESLWRTQPHGELPSDLGAVIEDLKRRQARFQRTVLWRDVREVGACGLIVVYWLYMGIAHDLPWTWYLGIPAALFTGGYMVWDRARQKQREGEPGAGGSYRDFLVQSIGQVEHQVWLLRNVFWYYLFPGDLAATAFFVHVGWLARGYGLASVILVVAALLLVGGVSVGVYWLNQYAVRRELRPRLEKLRQALASVDADDATPEEPAL